MYKRQGQLFKGFTRKISYHFLKRTPTVESVGPGYYECGKPETNPNKLGWGPFLSKQPRFRSKTTNSPGPAHYERVAVRPRRLSSRGQMPRHYLHTAQLREQKKGTSRVQTRESPAPGQYEPKPKSGLSIYSCFSSRVKRFAELKQGEPEQRQRQGEGEGSLKEKKRCDRTMHMFRESVRPRVNLMQQIIMEDMLQAQR